MLKKFRKDKGASAVEYGLMVALIAAILVVVVTFLGGKVQEKFKGACDKIAGVSCPQ